jgi:hypothetical protein
VASLSASTIKGCALKICKKLRVFPSVRPPDPAARPLLLFYPLADDFHDLFSLKKPLVFLFSFRCSPPFFFALTPAPIPPLLDAPALLSSRLIRA